jgi:hypothetical protein
MSRRCSTTSTSTPGPYNGNCCGNAASSATCPEGPWLGIDYKGSRRVNSSVPVIANASCFKNGQFLMKNRVTFPGAKLDCNGNVITSSDGSNTAPPGCSGTPRTTACKGGISQFCDREGQNGTPCDQRTLGKVQTFTGSIAKSIALAGTVAANPNVMIRATDDCGVPCCGEEGEVDGEIRKYNRFTCTWQLFVPLFATDADSEAIEGDGSAIAPYKLNLEYIAEHLEEIFQGTGLLEANNWQQVV